MLCTVHTVLAEFLYDDKKERKEKIRWFVSAHKAKALSAVAEASEELASMRFVQTLNELISTQKVTIQESSSSSGGVSQGVDVLGYWAEVREDGIEGRCPHIIMGRAMELVQKNLANSSNKIQHSKKAIVSELHEHGYILDEHEKARKMNNTSVRVVRFKPEALNVDDDIPPTP
jgi:hypothetical protein